MPELPEVEAVALALRSLVEGKRIRCVHVFHPIATRPQSQAQFTRIAEGRRIQGVRRHGKYLFLELDHGLIEMHFRFDGQLTWFRNARELLKRANAVAEGVHVDVAMELSKGVLGYADRRHFGRVHAWESDAQCKPLRRLGVDAMSREFTARLLEGKVRVSKRELKEFLMDQTKIAGIGNIYSCEALWRARLNPLRPADSLNPAEARRLHKAIVSVLARALECCLNPAPDFVDPQWWFQGLGKILRAYPREGKPCKRCRQPIRRVEQGGRSTYYCPQCQK